MQILIISRGITPVTTTSLSTAERSLYRLGRELSQMGHDIAITSPHFAHQVSGMRNKDRIRFYLTNHGHPQQQLEEICKFLRKWEWDLVHVDGALGHIPKIKTIVKCPVVGFVYGGLPVDQKARDLLHLDKGIEQADALLCHSERVKGEILAASPAAAAKTTVLGSGVDTSFFQPRLAGKAKAILQASGIGMRKVLLFTGRLEREKGLVSLQKAVFALPAELRSKIVILVVGQDAPAGQTTEPNRKEIHDLWTTKGCPMAWLGSRPPHEFPAIYNAAFVHVCSSSYEPFNLASIEAGACGVPTIGSTGSGIEELIQHEENGLLTPSGDVNALRVAIERLLTEPDLAAKLGANARQHAVDRWDWSLVADRYLAFYESLK